MTTVERPTQPRPAPKDAEALFPEAKQRERRRRLIWLGAVVIVAGATAGTVTTISSPSNSKPTVAHTLPASGAPTPTVDAKAFAHEGDLAFVSRGTLWVLDGGGHLQRIVTPEGSSPGSPRFSADGRWLSYVTSASTGGDDATELWIAHADGSDPHEITWLKDPSVIGWNPRSDELAVKDESAVAFGDGTVDRPTSVWLLSPDGARRELMTAPEVDGGAWSPDGSMLAVASDTGPVQTNRPWWANLVAYPVAEGKPTTWFRLESRTTLGPWKSNLILPVGWWPGWGIAFWTVTASGYDPSVLDGGGLDLWHVSTEGSSPQLLGSTLANGTLSRIIASSTGELAITNEPGKGGARPIWQNQQVERCSPTTDTCAEVDEPAGSVSLDPAWSPSGSTLAYVVGKSVEGGPFDQAATASWYNSLQLWLYNAKTGTNAEVPSVRGAVVPIWSSDGNSLLYVANDDLWLWKGLQGAPTKVAGPLFPPKNWNAYFGQIDWTDQFAWSK